MKANILAASDLKTEGEVAERSVALVRQLLSFARGASTFTTARQANNAIKKLGNPFRLWVLKLLDCGDRFIVTTDEKDQPPWFEKLR